MQTRILPYPWYHKYLSIDFVPRKWLKTSTLLLGAALFLSAELPHAGTQPTGEIAPLEDTYHDLSFAQAVDVFKKRLPREHKKDAYKLAKLLFELSDRYMFSPGLVLSLIETESSFRYDAVSKAGAIGLMQLLPSTAREVARTAGVRSYKTAADLFDPVTNMRLGVAYVAYLRSRFGNTVHYLAAYNMGPSALRNRMMKGNFELGAIEAYVRKIHAKTAKLREGAAMGPVRSQSFLRAKKLAAI